MIILHLMQTNHFYDALKENAQGRRKLLKEKKIPETENRLERYVTSTCYYVSLFCFITMATILQCFFVLFYYYGYYLTMFLCFGLLLWLLMFYFSLYRLNEACRPI